MRAGFFKNNSIRARRWPRFILMEENCFVKTLTTLLMTLVMRNSIKSQKREPWFQDSLLCSYLVAACF